MPKEPTNSHGYPVVLTANRLLMADYTVLMDGMVAAAQTTSVPALAMRGLLARPIPANEGHAARAPLGLRRIEAALIGDGFSPSDIVITTPADLPRVVGPGTRIIGVSCGDPLGLGMTTSTMEAMNGGRAYTRHWFSAVMKRIARLRHTFRFSVLVGGPGAWQLVQKDDVRREFGIDVVFTGYAERDIAATVRAMLSGDGTPAVVNAAPPEAAEIPSVRGPTVMGAVEISRGCGLGCDFCTINAQRMIHLSVDQVVADVETNVRHGVRSVAFLSEGHLFRYGSSGGQLDPSALVHLIETVRRTDGLRLIQVDHVNVTSIAQFDDAALKAVHDALVAGVRHRLVWVNVGVETASGTLLTRNGARAKTLPYGPDQWESVAESSIRRLVAAGFSPMISLVMGLPGEEPADVERTLRLVHRLPADRLVIFPVFFASTDRATPSFGMNAMTPLHWQLFRRCHERNFRWVPRMLWDNQRGAGVPLTRSLVLQAAGRFQALQWRARFILKTGRLRP